MLVCNNLTHHYDDGTIGVQNLNFDLNQGNIIGLIGANGSGKSTFFKCLLGLLKPQSGEILFKGSPLSYGKDQLKELRKTVNLIFQDPERQLFYSDVRQDIAMGPRNLGHTEDEIHHTVDQALDAVNGHHLTDRPIQYLSFGQKKRVAIAGVLALSCDVLLMDEPETGLDPLMRRDMVNLMNDLAQQGKKMVISSHNMDLIYTICDYVYVIHEGKIIKNGKKEVIMTDQELLVNCNLELPIQVAMRLNPTSVYF